jgi:YD repeat-containing protein
VSSSRFHWRRRLQCLRARRRAGRSGLADPGRPDPAIYTYGSADHVHAVTSVSGLGSYAYDAVGNMTQRVENGTAYAQTFDIENRLTQVVAGETLTTSYVYDADGGMLKRVRPDGTATVYVGMVEYELTAGGSVSSTTSNYGLPGARVVRTGSDVFWVLIDHLGSSKVTVNESGNSAVGEVRYEAFGATRVSTGDVQTDKLYTGQRLEDTGLYFGPHGIVLGQHTNQ